MAFFYIRIDIYIPIRDMIQIRLSKLDAAM